MRFEDAHEGQRVITPLGPGEIEAIGPWEAVVDLDGQPLHEFKYDELREEG